VQRLARQRFCNISIQRTGMFGTISGSVARVSPLSADNSASNGRWLKDAQSAIEHHHRKRSLFENSLL